MVLIIGGAARTGKGLLSRRLLLQTQQPYLSLDVLKMGLVNGNPNDWMEDYPDEDILELVMENIVFSRYLWGECERLSLAYFDTSVRFQEVHEQIIVHLMGGN
jgi:hypothetical protein